MGIENPLLNIEGIKQELKFESSKKVFNIPITPIVIM